MGNGYYAIMRVTDYGPYITKLVLPVDGTVKSAQVSTKQFCVYSERLDDNGKVLNLPRSWMAPDDKEPSCGYVPLTDAYASDRNGNRCEAGNAITLCLAYGPTMQLTAAICAPEGVNVYITNHFVITQIAEVKTNMGMMTGTVCNLCLGRRQPDLDGWLLGRTEHPSHPLRYGYFVPQSTQEKKPLIVWLHGAGEGGFDTWIPFTGNKVVAMATPEIQKHFGGAYIFAPQCETFWLDDGSGQYGRSGKSMYTEALFDAIEYFVARHADIDRDRIYVGGDSNGGFMTMRMILDYPAYFAAAFPVCEALYDSAIGDEEIKKVKHLPIWFTHAKTDPVVKPEDTVVPTYHRLKAAGAQIHFTFWDSIHDIHEGFKGEDGKPYEYNGHFAWIPLLNDDCRLDYDNRPVVVDGREISLLEWLSMQHR
ncbi:hypothetical protein FACS1894196_4020 [Clostridia bacterium]|nr:hypothetical protein FACS1894196_4020 [Clostridia bacterium]